MARVLMWVVLMGVVLVASSCANQQYRQTSGVHHLVLLWFKADVDASEARRIHEGSVQLADIEGVRSVNVGKAIASARPVVDDSFDLAVLFQFDSKAAMERYIDNPLHKAFVDTHIKGRMEKVLMYDF